MNFFRLSPDLAIILETVVRNDKVMQDFDSESLLMGGDHYKVVKAPPSEVIMDQKIASSYRLQLPFLGLTEKRIRTTYKVSC